MNSPLRGSMDFLKISPDVRRGRSVSSSKPNFRKNISSVGATRKKELQKHDKVGKYSVKLEVPTTKYSVGVGRPTTERELKTKTFVN